MPRIAPIELSRLASTVPNSPPLGVIEDGQPAEHAVAFGHRHDDQLRARRASGQSCRLRDGLVGHQRAAAGFEVAGPRSAA